MVSRSISKSSGKCWSYWKINRHYMLFRVKCKMQDYSWYKIAHWSSFETNPYQHYIFTCYCCIFSMQCTYVQNVLVSKYISVSVVLWYCTFDFFSNCKPFSCRNDTHVLLQYTYCIHCISPSLPGYVRFHCYLMYRSQSPIYNKKQKQKQKNRPGIYFQT